MASEHNAPSVRDTPVNNHTDASIEPQGASACQRYL